MAEAGAFLEQFEEKEKAKLAELQFAIVVGRFYEDLALRLLDGADHGFQMAGVPIGNVTHHSVPGAYELPFAANTIIDGVRRHNAQQAGGPEIGGVACLVAGGLLYTRFTWAWFVAFAAAVGAPAWLWASGGLVSSTEAYAATALSTFAVVFLVIGRRPFSELGSPRPPASTRARS